MVILEIPEKVPNASSASIVIKDALHYSHWGKITFLVFVKYDIFKILFLLNMHEIVKCDFCEKCDFENVIWIFMKNIVMRIL